MRGLIFDAEPTILTKQNYDFGLYIEYLGDDRYALANMEEYLTFAFDWSISYYDDQLHAR
jgi:hypothetical protein